MARNLNEGCRGAVTRPALKAFVLSERGSYMDRRYVLAVMLIGLLPSVIGCADQRPALARQQLEVQVAKQSNGAFAVAAFRQTNGYDLQREGMRLYTLEWEATLDAQGDGWKAGWAEYGVLKSPPNAMEAAVRGVSSQRILKGATAVLLGKSTLQKADRGWRVLDSTVTASKVSPPPDNPDEGRAAEISAFFGAFKKAVATKSAPAVAKFTRFPFSWQGTMTVTETEFLRHFPLTDEQAQAIAQTAAPTPHQDESYGVHTAQFAATFQRDRDGYWKWTDLYLGE